MDARDLVLRDCEHAERVACAQIILGSERKMREIGKLLQIVWANAFRIEDPPVVRHVLVSVTQSPLEPM